MFRAEAVAAQMINADPDKYGHHVLDEAEFEDTTRGCWVTPD